MSKNTSSASKPNTNTTSAAATLLNTALGNVGQKNINIATTAYPGNVTAAASHVHTGATNSASGVGVSSAKFSGSGIFSSMDHSRISVGAGSLITMFNSNNEEVVRLREDGIVIWKHGINIDDATRAFSIALRQGAVVCSGVGAIARTEIRSEIYANLINLAKEKGSLTIDDLTFDRDSCILVEKLANTTKE